MSDNDRDHDKDAVTDKEIFLECASRLQISAEAEGENRVNGIKALEFRDGDQWDRDIKNERTIDARPALTVNHTNVFCARVENTLRQQRPRIKCHPVSGGARVETAKVINGLIRNIETLSNSSVAYDKGGGSAVDIGWGYWRIVNEYCYELGDKNAGFNDQELLIRPIHNAFTVYDDPSARMPAGEDRTWLILSEKMKRTEYKIRYKGAINSDWHGGDAPGDMNLDWDNKEDIRLAEYYRIHKVADVLCQMTDGRVALKSELPDEETMIAANWRIAMRDGREITRPTYRSVVQWFRINGREVIEKRDLPGRYIPVIRCLGNALDINGKVKRKGMVADLMDPQRMFNYSETMKAERYALAPKAPWVAAEGQIEGHPEWQSANQKSYSTLVYKPIVLEGIGMVPPPQRQAPVQIEAGMAEWSESAARNLMAVAGVPQENPDISSRVISGNKYLQRRQGMQDLTHFQYYDNQTLAIMWTGIILLDLIPYYYDTERMQRIIGEDGVPEMVKINQGEPGENEDPEQVAIFNVAHNLRVGRYDVVMDTGPGYQTKREESTEAVLGLLGTPLGQKVADTSGDLVIRNMDFNGADDIADRMAPQYPDGMEKMLKTLPKQAQAIVGGLQQTIQMLKQTVQQQALEIKYKGEIEDKKLKVHTTVEAAKLETAEEKSKREDATKIKTNELDNLVKMQVAELSVAGQLLNTKVESEHEERAADKLIERGVE